jgi:hypothetical protein
MRRALTTELRAYPHGSADAFLALHSRRHWLDIGKPPAPWGWRRRKVENRDAFQLMPLWLYWLAEAWDRRYEWTFRPLRALGFWRIREGSYWWDGKLTAPRWLRGLVWCFLNDRDRYDAIILRFNRFEQPAKWAVKNIFEVKKVRRELGVPPGWSADAAIDFLLKSEPPAPAPW